MIVLLLIGGAWVWANKATGNAVSFNVKQFDGLFQKYASQYGLDWKMVKAIAMNESGLGSAAGGIEKSVLQGILFPKDIESSKSFDGKSWGIMQVTLPTAKQFDATATAEKLNNPEYSIKIACQYIAWVTLRFKTSDPRYLEWVVKSYNQGVGNTNNEQRGVFHAMSADVQKYWERYQRNYAKV